MKLWLLRPRHDLENSPFNNHDVTQGFVICANDEYDARWLADGKAGWENCTGMSRHDEGECDCKYPNPWFADEVTSCVELVPGCYPGIVIEDHRGGY